MSKKKQKKKSKIDIKTLAVSAILDLFVGILLMILDKLFNQLTGAKALLQNKYNMKAHLCKGCCGSQEYSSLLQEQQSWFIAS